MTTSRSPDSAPRRSELADGGSGGGAAQQQARCGGWRQYEEMLANNAGHSLPSGVWADALLLCIQEASGGQSHAELMSHYRRALSSCPYSTRLWCQLVDCQTRAGDPWEAVRDTCEAALNSGLHRDEDLAAIRAKMLASASLYAEAGR